MLHIHTIYMGIGKKMKEPREPILPTKPIEFYTVNEDISEIIYEVKNSIGEMSLNTFIKNILTPYISLKNDVYVFYKEDSYSEGISFFKKVEMPNKQYNAQLKKWNILKEKYDAELLKYEQDVIEYNIYLQNIENKKVMESLKDALEKVKLAEKHLGKEAVEKMKASLK